MQSAKVWRFLTFKKEHAYAPIGRVKALATFYYKNTVPVRQMYRIDAMMGGG